MTRVRRRLLRYPDDQRAIYLGAVALARDGRADEALAWSARAEALDPQDAVALYNLACVACVCGDAERGLRYLESAITPRLSAPELDRERCRPGGAAGGSAVRGGGGAVAGGGAGCWLTVGAPAEAAAAGSSSPDADGDVGVPAELARAGSGQAHSAPDHGQEESANAGTWS